MRIAAWNIERGGAGREDAIVTALRHHEIDLAVLVEFFPDRSAALVDRLIAKGFRWMHVPKETNAPPRVLISSQLKLEVVPPSAPDLELRNRWAEVILPDHDLRLAGVYVPVTGNHPGRKRRMWESVRQAAAHRKNEPFLIVGDWNTGDFPADKSRPGRPFKFTDQHRQLVEEGFVELWRQFHPEGKEYSWYRHDGSGFRIDHAFASPPLLPRVIGCRYSHQERVDGASDHSILIMDIEQTSDSR